MANSMSIQVPSVGIGSVEAVGAAAAAITIASGTVATALGAMAAHCRGRRIRHAHRERIRARRGRRAGQCACRSVERHARRQRSGCERPGVRRRPSARDERGSVGGAHRSSGQRGRGHRERRSSGHHGQGDVVTRAAHIRDPQRRAAHREDGALRQTREHAAHRVAAGVVDDDEGIAESRDEAQRCRERSAQRHVAGAELVVLGGHGRAVQLDGERVAAGEHQRHGGESARRNAWGQGPVTACGRC